MKKFFFLCAILASINLQAMSCFGTSSAKQQEARARVNVPVKAVLDISTDETGEVFAPVDGLVAAGVQASFLAYSHSGRFAAAANPGDQTMTVYSVDCESGAFTLIQTVDVNADVGSTTGVFEFAYSPCDNFAVLADNQGNVIVYSIDCKTGLWSLFQTVPNANGPANIDYSPDGRFVAVGTLSFFIDIYRVSPISGRLTFVASTPNLGNLLFDVEYSPNGKFLAITLNGGTGQVILFSVDPVTGVLTQVDAKSLPPNCVAFGLAWQHDGRFLAVADLTCGEVSVFSVNEATSTLSPTQNISTTPANTFPVYLAFSPDDSLAAVGSGNNPGSVVIFCVTNGTWCTSPIQTLPATMQPQSVAFAPCEDNAAVLIFGDGVQPGSVQVYEVNDDVCPVCP